MAEKSYRIRANVGNEQVIKTCLTQDIDFLEVLSLKINQMDTYKLHVSNYGIIVGRILANDGFGVPNAKVSVFLKLSDEDAERSDIVNFYPYKSITNNDKNNKRYNLLPDSSNDDCYKVVGTFPSKRLVLDNDTEIEIYEKYWKYTTVTNQSGDYMIFGVPTGNQTVHVDIDLSDIGILSQKPRDFFYKGYNKEQFDSAEQFKDANELDNLTQLLSQNSSVYVYPFFGDKNQNEIAITRCDINVSYKFEPTCVFIGSIISDRQGQHIGHKCGPSRHIGHNSNLVTGEGTIEMIRKTPDGLIEEFPIKANRLIDGDGVWCYQIPMNLDYICTDEFGNIIPTQDTRKGIPTRTSVRFRISLLETKGAPSAEHVAKHLVPSVHELDPQINEPHILNGSLYDNCYEFGSATPDEFFRDLLWNKVYSVKNYIPRIDYGKDTSRHYTGIRSVNDLNNKNNIFPFNSARLRLKFSYQLLCTIMSIVIDIVGFYNKLVTEIVCFKLSKSFRILGKKVTINFGRPLSFLSKWIKCIGFKGHYFFEEESNIYYFPRCDKNCGDGMMSTGGLTPITNIKSLKDRVQQALALEYDVVNLDFYNDWINGTLYFPLWFWRKRAKKKYFFGLFSSRAINTFCSCNNVYNRLSLSQSCSAQYDESFKPVFSEDSDYWHRTFGRRFINYGLIKEFTNQDGLNIYYYSPGAPNDNSYKTSTKSTNFTQLFATDIILLGSLNNCDLDNLPKTFDSLPSSTVNLPFIATFNNDESGDGVVSGLDWGHNGKDMKIAYQDGLLIDLTCWTVHTKYKSCVNLSRLSELNVTFDMDVTTDDKNEPNIKHDGLITDKELLDHEVRAKFASLNHNGLTTLVKNPTTNYDTYKFHYIYPVNFDGHLGNMYRNTINSDISDSNYIMYRLGEGKDSTSKTPLRHKKHFYGGTEKNFNFPLYNNSFYFYFGLNEGNTAIDKFNSEFNSLCAKRNAYSFSIDHKTKPGKWCYDVNKITTDFGTIDIEFNGLTDVFSYTLYNDFNEVVISEENVNNHDLRFGYAIAEGGGSYIMTNDGYKKDGRIIEFNTGNIVTNSFGEPKFLENGIYYLEVVNSFGLKVTQKITMTQNVLTPNFEEIRLGTKFKENIMTSQDICGEMDFHGELKLKSFIIDGEETYITNVDNYFIDGLTHYYVINGINIYPNDDSTIEYNGVIYEEKYNSETEKYYIDVNGDKLYSKSDGERRYYVIGDTKFFPNDDDKVEYENVLYEQIEDSETDGYYIEVPNSEKNGYKKNDLFYFIIQEKFYANHNGTVDYNGNSYTEYYDSVTKKHYIVVEDEVIYGKEGPRYYYDVNDVHFYLLTEDDTTIDINGVIYNINYESDTDKNYIEVNDEKIYEEYEDVNIYIYNNYIYPNYYVEYNGVTYNEELVNENFQYYINIENEKYFCHPDNSDRRSYYITGNTITSGTSVYSNGNGLVDYKNKSYIEYYDYNINKHYIIDVSLDDLTLYDKITCRYGNRYYDDNDENIYLEFNGKVNYNGDEYEEQYDLDTEEYYIEVDGDKKYCKYGLRFYEINGKYYVVKGSITYQGKQYEIKYEYSESKFQTGQNSLNYCIELEKQTIYATHNGGRWFYIFNDDSEFSNNGILEYNGTQYTEYIRSIYDENGIDTINYYKARNTINSVDILHYYNINDSVYYPYNGIVEYNEVDYKEQYNSETEEYYIEVDGDKKYATNTAKRRYYIINNIKYYPDDDGIIFVQEEYTNSTNSIAFHTVQYKERKIADDASHYIRVTQKITAQTQVVYYYEIDGNKYYPNTNGYVNIDEKTYQEQKDSDNNNYIIVIQRVESTEYEQPKEITCKVTCTDGSQIYLIIEPENDETQDISNFVCYGIGSVPSISKTIQGNVNGQEIYTLIFNIWRPGDYVITSNQICNGIMNDNVSINTFSIENGENFMAYINDVPLTVINNDYFKGEKIVYAEDNTTVFNDSFPRVWLQLENPLIYDFKTTKLSDVGYWDDFCNIVVLTSENNDGEKNSYVSPLSKIEILSNQLKIISEMRNLAYVSQKQGNQLTLTSKGGKEPILVRNIHPLYSIFDENNNICNDIIIDNNNSLELPIGFPLIIDENYQNDVYETKKIGLNYVNYPNIYNNLGNYFGVFTNNGGLITLNNGKNIIDASLYSQSFPDGIDVLPNYSVITNQVVKSYPQRIIYNVNKYIRLLSIDKRLIIGGDFYLPVYCQYDINNNDNTWNNGNLQLRFYNVAPLVYDTKYNIIGENLSYEIKKVSDEIFEENITTSNDGNYKLIITTSNDGNYKVLTIQTNSYFNGCGEGFENNNIIKGYDYSEILIKLRSICDTIATDINFDNLEAPNKIIFKKLETINSDNDFNSDSDIRLVSNLMWYSDLCDVSSKKQHLRRYGKLHTCYYSVDGNEYDIRDKYEHYLYSSENYAEINKISYSVTKDGNLSIPYGNSFAIEASNCKMNGILEYEEEVNDDGLNYNFKSFIESDEVNTKEMTISKRVNIKSAVLFFTPKKYGKYTIYNNYKIYENHLKDDDLLVLHGYCKYDFLNSSDVYHFIDGENEYTVSVNRDNGNTVTLSNETNTIDGYLWSKNTILYDINGIADEFLSGGAVNLSYEQIKDKFNKYGIPIYSMFIYKPYKESDQMDFKIAFDPHNSGDQISLLSHYKLSSTEYLLNFTFNGITCWIISGLDIIFTNNFGVYERNQRARNILFYQSRENYDNKPLPVKCQASDENIEIKRITSIKVEREKCKYCYLLNDSELVHTTNFQHKNFIDGELYAIIKVDKVNGISEFKKLYKYYSYNNNYYHNYKGDAEISSIKINTSTYTNIYAYISEKELDETYNELKIEIVSEMSKPTSAETSLIINNTYINTINLQDNIDKEEYVFTDEFTKYTIHSIEDFSCTINKDDFSENYSFISAYAPFLSYGIKKQYGMQTELSSITIDKNSEIEINSFVNENSDNITNMPTSNIISLSKRYAFFENNCYPFKQNKVKLNRKILNLYGYNDNDYSHRGIINIKNYINENINVDMTPYNSSIANFIPKFVSDSNDINILKTYKKDAMIGEMYPYINKNFFTINGYQELNNLYGCPYGNYLTLYFKHPNYDKEVHYVIDIVVYQPIAKVITKEEEEVENIGVSKKPTEIEFDENNEFYDDLLYVLQPNSYNSIDENVDIITCNFVKSYESNNENFNREVINQYSQDVLFHAGPLYFGNSIKRGNKYYIPCIILNQNINEDIANIFKNKDLKYSFGNQDYSFNSVTTFDTGIKYYEIKCTDGYSNYYASGDIIRCIRHINLEKLLVDITIEELIINPIEFELYHFEQVDGKFYDFVSTIEDISEVTNVYYLHVDVEKIIETINNTTEKEINLVLSIQKDNITYKFPFHFIDDGATGNFQIKTGFL